MAELPIMPVKTDALLADTSHMTAEEFGAYCRILFAMWRHQGRLPDNQRELARIAGLGQRRWSKIAEVVMRPLTISDGKISQKRLTSTWLDVQEIRKKRSEAANKRWSTCNASAYPNDMHVQSISNANQNQNQISSSLREKTAGAGSLATALPTGALREPAGKTITASSELQRIMAGKGR